MYFDTRINPETLLLALNVTILINLHNTKKM